MSSNDKEERLIAKIRKLFALSANAGATGAEAETALRMANALLAKHAIDKHKLNETDKVFCSFMDYPIKHQWVKSVCGHIARFYNCRVIFDYTWDNPKTLIIGTSASRITAIIVIDQLLEQIKRGAKGEGVAFKNGAAAGLYEKCQEIITQRNRETGNDEVIPGTGLTIIDVETQQKRDSDEFVDENFANLKSGKRASAGSAAGRAFGSGLNPNARMGGAGQKCLS